MKLVLLPVFAFGLLHKFSDGFFIARSIVSFDNTRKELRGICSSRNIRETSRTTLKAVAEHFNGDPSALFAQVFGVGGFLSGGYYLAGKSADIDESNKHETEIDIYRDTPLRYLGYANEVGEAFRPLINVNIVYLSYLVALGYVTSDAVSKAMKAPGKFAANFEGSDRNPIDCAFNALTEVLSFQLLASVALPGFTINRIVLFLQFCIEKYDSSVGHLPELVLEWGPTIGGLCAIPLIVKPLDVLVETVLEYALNPLLEKIYPPCHLPIPKKQSSASESSPSIPTKE
jgi:fission process protein 1